MRFSNASLDAVLDDWCDIGDPTDRACGHNLRHDERLDGPRGAAFEAIAARSASNPDLLRRAAVDYYRENVYIFHATPETFTPVNATANVDQLSPEQTLVRLESLSSPLAKCGISFDDLSAALQATDAAARALVDGFILQWNTRPDIRRNPVSFAAFKDQLIGELSMSDWPDKLRDRLGLAHFDPRPGPIPVALMEYEVQEVATAHLPMPFHAPTTLDGEPYAQFFPTPLEMNFGCPMALYVTQSDDDLVAEILHPRLVYGRKHLKRLGLIEAPVVGVDFVEMRNNHAWALRLATLRDGFGADL